MEAKNTVMTPEQWDKVYSDWLEYPGGTAGDLANKMNNAQAEISFSAGAGEVVRWLTADGLCEHKIARRGCAVCWSKQLKKWGL